MSTASAAGVSEEEQVQCLVSLSGLSAADALLLLKGTGYDLLKAGDAIFERGSMKYYIDKARRAEAEAAGDTAQADEVAAEAESTQQPSSTSSEADILAEGRTRYGGIFEVLKCGFDDQAASSTAVRQGEREPTEYLVRRQQYCKHLKCNVTVLGSITMSGQSRQYDTWVHMPLTCL